jgi:beta-glucuronidase
MKRIVLGLIAVLLLAVSGFASTRLDLNHGWLFRTDADGQGEKASWQKSLPSEVEPVDLPNTWNTGVRANYIGKAWYFHRFNAPSSAAGARTELHFGSVFYSAHVWLNGVEIGRHEGGYTAFSLDITPHLKADNYLAVEVDNTISANTIPGFALRGDDRNYDWWNYGGIVRDVWLTVGGPLQVERQRIRSQIKDGHAVVADRLFLKNALAAPQKVTVSVNAFDPSDRLAGTDVRTVTIAPGAKSLEVEVKINAPQLWDIDHPNVYRMVVRLASASGRVQDEHSDTFGLRTVEIHDRHLLLNGARVRLTGLDRHEETLREGLAETAGSMRYDYDDMKALQMTLTRPVHYPQNPFILDYADRHGILLIPEIPVWQFSEAQLKDPKVIETAKQQMREMIEEAGNHPSIFAWSVCNESASGTPGGIEYFRTMRDYIRTLDPDRYVSFADDNLPKLARADQSAANDADFIMMNQYFGTWHGPGKALGDALDKIDRLFPNKMVIISEFGVPGLFADNAVSADELRARIIQEQMPELAKRDWIAGAILWCYQDYKSHRNLRKGMTEGFVDHGLVDEFRQRKPSYYVWKDVNAPASLNVKHMGAENNAANFTVEVKPNAITDIPSYPLRGYKLSWQLVGKNDEVIGGGEQEFADLSSVQEVTRSVAARGAAKLRLTLSRPTGEIAVEKTINWTDNSSAAKTSGVVSDSKDQAK